MISPLLSARHAETVGMIMRRGVAVRDFKMRVRVFNSQAQADIYGMKHRVDALEKIFAARYERVLLENE